ncbi:hypothetical protein [Candidatus Thioglobus sp.]|uniref:hypothetical protein n=1 Tax=Candidatus Thioglobus sp. TaxID=2026721 RepID=UPI0026383EF3|nr:hypothetical protein [Candidatus Thioglobus sp.]MDG2394725.1 hypothetical protein [Candidatus Thioglobus sp.]
MLKILLLLSFLLSGCEDQKQAPDEVLKPTTLIAPEKQTHHKADESPICAQLSVNECLRIIIPAIWEREVERDC